MARKRMNFDISHHACIRYLERILRTGAWQLEHPYISQKVNEAITQAVMGGRSLSRKKAKKLGVMTGHIIVGADGNYYLMKNNTIITVDFIRYYRGRHGRNGTLQEEEAYIAEGPARVKHAEAGAERRARKEDESQRASGAWWKQEGLVQEAEIEACMV